MPVKYDSSDCPVYHLSVACLSSFLFKISDHGDVSSNLETDTVAYDGTSSPYTTVIRLCTCCGEIFSSVKNSITAR